METNYFKEALQIIQYLYGHNVQMAFATIADDGPSVRIVDFFYEDGSFYTTCWNQSNKVSEIKKNPKVALCKGYFRGWGKAINLGCIQDPKNKAIDERMKVVFSSFYDKHANFPDTDILKINLDKAIVCANDFRYIVDFVKQEASRTEFIADAVIL